MDKERDSLFGVNFCCKPKSFRELIADCDHILLLVSLLLKYDVGGLNMCNGLWTDFMLPEHLINLDLKIWINRIDTEHFAGIYNGA